MICAETDEEAERLASSRRMAFSMLAGTTDPGAADGDRAAVPRGRPPRSGGPRRRGIVGSPETVRAGLEAVAREYGADELMVLTITHDHAARRRSYDRADAVDLPVPRAGAPSGR